MPLDETIETHHVQTYNVQPSARNAHATSAKKFHFPGVQIDRFFTKADQSPYDTVEWELRRASIVDRDGRVFFEQDNIEVPRRWSQTASNIVAQIYFRQSTQHAERENSVRQMVERVVNTLTDWGINGKYFASQEDGQTFRDELAHLILNQAMAFNSPVWFNVGTSHEAPQCSACYINSVHDSLEAILELVKTEGLLFKQGSGTGTNLSSLRSSRERLGGGGIASGPLSFMRGYDAFAGAIKAGGRTRRAAKMVILNAEHPDIVDFIQSKLLEEFKARALMDAGYNPGFNVAGGAYDSVAFQNQNHSIRVTDEFMQAVANNEMWVTRAVTDGRPIEALSARFLMRKMAYAAHQCGDPGLQFDTTINRYNTCAKSGRIEASNPCAEFVFLNDTACNLASLNLLKFQRSSGAFNVEAFEHAIDLCILAQDIIVSHSRYPTARIGENCRSFRPLGLGFANLGALLMSHGLPYDCDEARTLAGSMTALLGGRALAMSARIARDAKGAFAEYQPNESAYLETLTTHRADIKAMRGNYTGSDVLNAAERAWDTALQIGEKYGFRNAQVTAIAPTGTIGLMMDCDTTGIEPDMALVKYKNLSGGGGFKILSQSIAPALVKLGYSLPQIHAIQEHILAHETIEGSPTLKEEHLEVFDCALQASASGRSIHALGHLKMMAACQPFISGAISKTVNLPRNATIEEIENVFNTAWRLGLKSITIYRDGSKGTQPVVSCGSPAGCEVVNET